MWNNIQTFLDIAAPFSWKFIIASDIFMSIGSNTDSMLYEFSNRETKLTRESKKIIYTRYNKGIKSQLFTILKY